MKKFLTLLLGLLCYAGGVYAADGDIFTVNAAKLVYNDVESTIDMKFQVISEEEKTVKVYGSYIRDVENFASISEDVKGHLTVPSTVEYNGVTYAVVMLGAYAFQGCALTTLRIPDSVKKVDEFAILALRSLESLYIGSGVEAFNVLNIINCAKLKTIEIDENNETYYASHNNAIITKSTNPRTFVRGCDGVVVPKDEGITAIGPYAFWAKYFKTFEIPEGVTEVGIGAFEFVNLSSIKFPQSLEKIGNMAFISCTSLTSVTFPSNLKIIAGGAFCDCTALKSISLPASLEEIGANAFRRCTSLTDIYCEGAPSNIEHDTEKVPSFYEVPKSCTLHVPANYADGYRSNGWEYFTGPLDVSMSDDEPYTHTGAVTGDAYQTKAIHYTRTFTNTHLQAVYIPYGIPEAVWKETWATPYELVGMSEGEDGALELEIAEKTKGDMMPNTPYLCQADYTGTANLTLLDGVLYDNHTTLTPRQFTLTRKDGKTYTYTFTGVHDYYTNPSLRWYAMSQGEIYRASATARLHPGRWYMTVNDGEDVADVKIKVKDTETGINAIDRSALPLGSSKNGQLIIDNAMYDLSGRRVSLPSRGIYVRNGKKYVK